MAIDLVEAVDLGRNARPVAPPCERSRPPVGDRHDDDAAGFASREFDGAPEDRAELRSVLPDVAPLVLVVDADQKGHEAQPATRGHPVDAFHEVAGRPSGAIDDTVVCDVVALLPQETEEALR